MRKPPRAIERLLAMATSEDVSQDDLREALSRHDKAQLKRHGFHLVQAVEGRQGLLAAALKFAVVHEALGSPAWVLWSPLSSLIRRDDEHLRLSDEDAALFTAYLLDVLKAGTFPGLIYQACHFGFKKSAALFRDRGIYAPLSWNGYSGDKDADGVRFVRTLLEVVNPSTEDIEIIRGGFKTGTQAAQMLDMALARPSVAVQ